MQGTHPALKYLLILLIAVTYGCGGGSSSSEEDSGSDGNNSGNSGSGNQSTELEGVWKKSCGISDATDPDSFHDIITLTFTGNGFNSDIENFEDAGCQIPLALSPNPSASGTFILGNSVSLAGGNSATQLDTHIVTYNGAPFEIDDYTIYLIDNNILYLGADDDVFDGSSAMLRSQTLDYNRPYIRQ